MKKLKIYLDTSVLNFIYAEDVVKRNATINLFRLTVSPNPLNSQDISR